MISNTKTVKHCPRYIGLCCIGSVIICSGCASMRSVPWTPHRRTPPLFDSAALPFRGTATHEWRFLDSGKLAGIFRTQCEISDERVVLVGLTGMYNRLFTVEARDGKVASEQSPFWTGPVDPATLLWLFQLAYWPSPTSDQAWIDSKQAGGDEGWFSIFTKGNRIPRVHRAKSDMADDNITPMSQNVCIDLGSGRSLDLTAIQVDPFTGTN